MLFHNLTAGVTTENTEVLMTTTTEDFLHNETINNNNLNMSNPTLGGSNMFAPALNSDTTTSVYQNSSESTVTAGNDVFIGFFVSLLTLFLPGMFAHVIALYCLIHDIGSKMILAKRLLLCLCVVDMLGLCSILTYQVIVVFINDPPRLLCAINSFIVCFLPLMSGGLTTYMAVERCVKFCTPFWHALNASTWKMKTPIVVAAAVFATVALFPVSGLGYIATEDGSKCLTFPTTVPKLYNSPGGIFIIAYAGVGMATVIIDVTANCITISTLASIRSRRMDIGNVKGDKAAEVAMAWMLFWLSCVFLITLSPLYLSLITLYSGFTLDRTVKMFTHFLAGLNFTLDPFIYLTTMKTYRHRAALLLTCFRRRRHACATGSSVDLKNSTQCSSVSK